MRLLSQKPVLVTVVPFGWRFWRLVWIALAWAIFGPLCLALVFLILAAIFD